MHNVFTKRREITKDIFTFSSISFCSRSPTKHKQKSRKDFLQNVFVLMYFICTTFKFIHSKIVYIFGNIFFIHIYPLTPCIHTENEYVACVHLRILVYAKVLFILVVTCCVAFFYARLLLCV